MAANQARNRLGRSACNRLQRLQRAAKGRSTRLTARAPLPAFPCAEAWASTCQHPPQRRWGQPGRAGQVPALLGGCCRAGPAPAVLRGTPPCSPNSNPAAPARSNTLPPPAPLPRPRRCPASPARPGAPQESEEGHNDTLGFGLSAMQGWRVSMVRASVRRAEWKQRSAAPAADAGAGSVLLPPPGVSVCSPRLRPAADCHAHLPLPGPATGAGGRTHSGLGPRSRHKNVAVRRWAGLASLKQGCRSVAWIAFALLAALGWMLAWHLCRASRLARPAHQPRPSPRPPTCSV